MKNNMGIFQKAILLAGVLGTAATAQANLVQITPGQNVSNTGGLTTLSTTGLNLPLTQIIDYTSAYTSYSGLYPWEVTDSGTITTEVFRVGSATLGAPLLFEYTIHNTDLATYRTTNTVETPVYTTNITHTGSGIHTVYHTNVYTSYTTSYTYTTNHVDGGPASAGLTFFQASSNAVGFGTANISGVQDNVPTDNTLELNFNGPNGELASNATAVFYVYTTDPYTQPGGAAFLGGISLGSATIYAALPEPGTIISGALLVLPLGASTIRILRRKALSRMA